MRVFKISFFIAVSFLAAGCTGTATTNDCPLRRAAAEQTNVIRAGDQLYILIEDIDGPGEISHLERTVDQGGFIVLPYMDKVHLGGVAIHDAPRVIHQACRNVSIDGEGSIWVWRLEGAERPNDPNAPLAAGDLLKILMTGINHRQTDEFLVAIANDGAIQINGLGSIPAAHRSERQVETAIASAMRAKGFNSVMVMVWKLAQGDR